MISQRLRSGNLAAPLFCVAAVVINHSVFRLGAMPLAWAVLFVGAVALTAMTAPDVPLRPARMDRLRWSNALLGILIVAPLIVTFAIGWDRDFPFSGDHYFHVGQAYRFAFWWLSPFASTPVRAPAMDDVRALLQHPGQLLLSRAVLLVLVATTTIGLYRWRRLAALAFATVAVVSWGLCEQTILLRYPGGGYFIDLPFLGPGFLLGNVELGGRLANIAAPAMWLFVLRPWLIGRWPDLRVLPVGLLLFWHRDVIYYFDTVYLEPWAVMFSLLAVESLIARGWRGAPVACLLIGAAATVKEPFIVALPLVWLAGAPWRRSLQELLALTGAAFAAGASFVLYFAAHNALEVTNLETGRGLHFGFPFAHNELLAREFVHRVAVTFTGTTALAALAALLLVPLMVWLFPARRLQIVLLSGSGLALLLMFVVEHDSLGWVGNFRFLLPAFPFLAAGLLAFGYALRPRWAFAVAVAVLALQAQGASQAIARAAGPVSGLNFIENYDAAIFFPMKSLIAEARGKGLLPAGETVLANAPDTSLRVIPGIPVTYASPGVAVCACSRDHPVVMSLFVRYSNLTAPSAGATLSSGGFGSPADRGALWRAAAAERPLCLASLERTCGHLFRRIEGGEPVAVLGTLR